MEGLIFAILSPFLSSISTIFKTQAVQLLNPFLVLSFGSFFGAAILLAALFLRKQNLDIEKIKKNKKDLLLLILSRQILGELLFTYGLSLTVAIKAIFFTKAEPYFVLFWFWVMAHEKVKKEYLILLFVHIIGAIILSTGSFSLDFGKSQLGDLLIILAMTLFSLSYFPASRVSKELGAIQTNFLMLTFAGIIFLPFVFIFSNADVWTNTLGWIYLVVQATIFTSTALTLWFASLKTVKGWMVSALRSLGPLIGAPFAYYFFGESLNLIQIIGGAIVLATSYLIAREHMKNKK